MSFPSITFEVWDDVIGYKWECSLVVWGYTSPRVFPIKEYHPRDDSVTVDATMEREKEGREKV